MQSCILKFEETSYSDANINFNQYKKDCIIDEFGTLTGSIR